jgi:signal transduction histidine kinase/DNA-binding NarL/FixJ family response regulator
MTVEYTGSVLLVGGHQKARENIRSKLEQSFPGLKFELASSRNWRQVFDTVPHLQPSVILCFDNNKAPLPSDVLRRLEIVGERIPVIGIGPDNRAREAVALLRTGAADYFTEREIQNDEFIPRIRPFIPHPQVYSTSILDKILNITHSAVRSADLTDLLRSNLKDLISIANGERGMILLRSSESYVVGAFEGMTEDRAVLVASLDHGPIHAADRAQKTTIFETPAEIPGDDPVIWSLVEAQLLQGYLTPIVDKDGMNCRGIAVIATKDKPHSPVPWPLLKAGQAVAEAITIKETLAITRDENRSTTIRLNNQSHELSLLYKLMSQFGERKDLPGIANHLARTLSMFAKPDIIAIYAASGRVRFHDVREANPLPLKSVHDFETWFNSRLYKEFGPEALRNCPSTSISKGQRLAEAALLTYSETPPGFAFYDWIPLQTKGPAIGAIAIAIACTRNHGYGKAQKELVRAMAEHASQAIKHLTHTQDERQTLVKSLLEGLPVGVALLDAYGRIALANPTGMELLRAAGSVSSDDRLLELCGERFYDVTVGIEQSRRSFSRERRVGESVFFISVASVPLPMQFGTEQPADTSQFIRPELQLAMHSTGYAIALRDVTGPHEIREQLVQAEKLSTIGVMVSGVAHELNNPLTGIRGYSELLLERKSLPKGVKDDLKRIHKNAARCARIVSDLLAFSRKRQQNEPIEVNLAALLGEVFDLLFLQLKASRVMLKRDFDRRVPMVPGDPHQLQQVFINLINNAQQAITEEKRHNGVITVRLRSADDKVFVIVEDNGPGIRPEHQARLFDPFFSTKSTKGTGLGLSICYGIVRDHGGTIRAESPPGCGARFTTELPIATTLSGLHSAIDIEDLEPARDSEFDIPIGPIKSTPNVVEDDLADESSGELLAAEDEKLVLVVDNTPVVRRLVMDVLTTAGYTVDVAADAEEAMATLKFMEYDIVLSSLDLAGLGGQSLFHALKEKSDPHANRLVFMIDSRDAHSPKNSFLQESDAPPFIEKPFSHQNLISVVESILLSDSTPTL